MQCDFCSAAWTPSPCVCVCVCICESLMCICKWVAFSNLQICKDSGWNYLLLWLSTAKGSLTCTQVLKIYHPCPRRYMLEQLFLTQHYLTPFMFLFILFVHLEKSVVSKPWSKPGLLVSEPNILSQSSSVLQPRLMKLKGGVLLLGEMWHNVKKVIWSLDCLFTFLSPRNISRSDTWSIQLCINWEHW